MMPTGPATIIDQRPAMIPPKIQAALAFTQFCYHVTQGSPSNVVGGHSDGGRALSPLEKRCYDAAISAMTEYFNSDAPEDDPPHNPGGGNAPKVDPQVPVKK